MSCIFHFMRSPGQCRKVDAVSLEQQPAPSSVSYFCPADTDFIAAFLGNHVACQVVDNCIFVDTKFCTFLTVCICLCRSHSIPFYLIIICIDLHNHSEFRHITKFRYWVIRKRSFDGSISVDCIGNAAVRYRFCCQMISECDCHGISGFFYQRGFRCIRLKILMRWIETGKFPLSVPCHHLVSFVIIYRCTPEVRLRNAFDHLCSAITVGCQSTV